ncbi:glycoside hydrolase family 31 protein [Isoptericola sp. b490]|uniref:glycoside hydrolase family 31 protein n=1 Tax=Actinotalea lenta TaxID=3064654 RepID=UPI002713C5D4|nr:TIM-barrel domain-containing protein [Isoptericola sp. b490]MDO8122297.1 glycoside hydrolase family 31 protein [Isoptericola sp. b490]
MTLQHRPHGVEHPYAASADQRTPVLPVAGERVRLGVVVDGPAGAPRCEWQDASGAVQVLDLAPAGPSADAAALAGGEGHLAEAQAAQLADEGGWAVTTGPLAAGRHRYRFVAGDEATAWFDVNVATWAPHGGRLLVGGREDHPRLAPGSVRWLRDDDGVHRVRFALRLEPSEHVVGFGERFDALDQRGRTPDAVVFEQYKAQGEHRRTYLPMPFAHVVGGDGWGFHVRTTRRTWYDVGATEPDLLVVEATLGGAEREQLDVAVYEGDPATVLTAFGDEVGRAEELPDWVLRLWASGNEWHTQEIVTQRMDTHRDLDIPVGVVVVEAWSDELGITEFGGARWAVHADGSPRRAEDFTFPADGPWPDPAGWVADMHERGIKVVLWQIPLLKTDETIARDDTPWRPDQTGQVLADGAALERDGHVVREADGTAYRNRGWWFPRALMPDLSTPEGRAVWTEYRRYLVEDLDVDGFKTDGGEHAWGHDLRYADGRRGDEANNLNPVHFARAFGDLLRSCGKPPVTFSRAGFTGSQAHGIVWAGDEDSTWAAFEHSITAGLSASACGIVYWGWDLAGFSGPVPEPELYLRATAAATFMPVMQYHSEFHHHRPPLRDRTPWNVARTHDDPEVVDVFRRYAHLRERLVPYLAEQARVAIAASRPLMRAMFVDHPRDERYWAFPHQFQLGDDLLVHPVTRPGVERWGTALPEGAWVDVWSGETVTGGGVVEREVPRDVVPVWCRAEAWPRWRAVFRP